MQISNADWGDQEPNLVKDGADRLCLSQELVRLGGLSPATHSRALSIANQTGQSLAVVLTSLGLMTEEELAKTTAEAFGLDLIDKAAFPDAPVLPEALSAAFLEKALLLPVAIENNKLIVAGIDPTQSDELAALRFACGTDIVVRIGRLSEITSAIESLYAKGEDDEEVESGDETNAHLTDDIDRLRDVASEAPVVRFVNQLLAQAVDLRASDIHIEPMEQETRLRLRVDGVLKEISAPPTGMGAAIVSRIKILAKLNIAERRLAQDGRMRLSVRGQGIDFRVSTTPTIHGESLVMRLLDRGSLKLDFDELGFEVALQEKLHDLLRKPEGIVLVTGPTGSGKTTTLYTALMELNQPDKKILTVEDPVEYQLKGINQVHVRPDIGHTFATALRSFLRQDPRHHSCRRNPRCGDSAHRGSGGAYRASYLVYVAHERCSKCDYTPA